MKEEKFHLFKGISKCLNLIYSYDKKYLIISAFMAVLQGIVPSISLMLCQKILNSMQIHSKSINEIFILLVIYLLLNIFPEILFSIYDFYKMKFQRNFEKHIDILMLEKATNLNLIDFEDNTTYDMITRAQNQKGENILLLFDNVFFILKESISIISLVAILVQFKIYLILIVIIIPILNSLYSIKIGKEQYKVSVNRTWKERKIWYIDYLLLTGHAYKEIQLFDVGNKLISKFKQLKENIISQDIKILKKNFFADILFTTLDSIVYGGVIGYIIIQGFLKKILIGDVTAYIQALQSIKDNVQSIVSTFSTIINNLFFTNLLFEFLEYEPVNQLKEGLNLESEVKKIELIDLSYKYPNSQSYALKNINLIIEKDNPVAILGKNGSGKTTLLKIILGFYEDYEGQVLVNGVNLKCIKKAQYRKKISCMFQDFIKYETTVRDNISISTGYKEDIDKFIINKLNATNLKNKFKESEGLNTVLGTWFGTRQLSSGEWQKIAICRSLIRDADIYIFDEPNSAIDIKSSNELLLLYKEALKNKIGIFITHHIPHAKTITKNIVVLQDGELIEMGSHEDLISQKGVYFELFCNCN